MLSNGGEGKHEPGETMAVTVRQVHTGVTYTTALVWHRWQVQESKQTDYAPPDVWVILDVVLAANH